MNQSDLRVIRSKKLIRDAFIDLMEEQGYKNITIQAVSKRAMINRKTFYNHYDSIDAVFADILRTTIGLLLEGLAHDNSEDCSNSPEELYDKIKTFLHNLSNNMRLINILINDISSHELTKQLSRQFLQKVFTQVAASHLRKEASNVPVDLLSISIAAVFISLMRWYIENNDSYSEEDAAQIFIELLSRGYH